MNRTELIKQAIESAKCRIYKLNFDTNKELSAHHQKKAENQKELMEITVEALERMLWTPCSVKLPNTDKNEKYIVTRKKGSMCVAEFICKADNGKMVEPWWSVNGLKASVIAWMEMPEAYKGE